MPEKDLRIGVIGVGMMGADHAERVVNRVAGARLVAVSDPDPARAADLAAALDGVRSVADPLGLIADPEVDAVVIASPGFVHEEQVLACLEHGKYALCEKPLTMDSESSLRLVEAEAKGGRPLVQVGFMRRFDPEYTQMKAMLDSGQLGRTLLLHNTHRNKTVPDSFRSEMIVRDSLVHEVDVARFIFGEEIVEITVVAGTPTGVAAEGGPRPPGLALPDGRRRTGHLGGVRQLPGRLRGAVRGGRRARHRHGGQEQHRHLLHGVRRARRLLGRPGATRLPGPLRPRLRPRGPGLGRRLPPW